MREVEEFLWEGSGGIPVGWKCRNACGREVEECLWEGSGEMPVGGSGGMPVGRSKPGTTWNFNN